MMDEFSQMWESLPPEVQEQLLGMGTLDERGALLQQQMAQAEALRQPSGKQYSTGLGAALGGLGDVTRMIGGTMDMGRLQKEQEALLGKKDAGRMSFARYGLRGGAQPQDVLPASPFAL